MFGQLVDFEAARLRGLVVALIAGVLDAVVDGALVLLQVALLAGNVVAAVAGKPDKILCVTVFFVPFELDGGGGDETAVLAVVTDGAVGRAFVQLEALQVVHLYARDGDCIYVRLQVIVYYNKEFFVKIAGRYEFLNLQM